MNSIGSPTSLDDFIAIPKDMLLEGLKGFEFKNGSEDPVKLTPVQIGKLAKSYSTLSSASCGPAAAPPLPKHPPVADAAVKLAHVVNESLEGFVHRASNEDMTKLLTVYQHRCGGLPRNEIEPTRDQIGALRQVLDSGAAP